MKENNTSASAEELGHVLLGLGLDAAYHQHDYRAAHKYYQSAAALGNLAALCNLGYSWYYGRSGRVDKEKARTCWETAAVMGDPAATYKLGDMHRNGDIESNEDLAWQYYLRAWQLSQDDPDPLNYPDICLRLARYGGGRLPDEVRGMLADIAVYYFKQRIAEGDILSDAVLAEAEALREQYLPQ